MTHAGTPLALTLTITGISVAITGFALQYRDRPGGRPFVGIMVLISFQAFMGVVDWFALGRWPIGLATFGGFVMTAVWLLFALEYTGYTRFINRYTVAAISIVPALVAAVGVVRAMGMSPREVFPAFVGLLFPLHFLGTIVLGNLLLLKFALVENRLYTDQSFALIIGMAAPFVGYVLNNIVDNPLPGDGVLIALGVTGPAFAFALFRFELFSVLPITQQIGRDAAIEDLRDGVLIVDPTGQVVDANEAANTIFGQSSSALIGKPVSAVFGEQAPPESEERVAPPEYRTTDGRIYGVAVSEIQNRNGRHVGWTAVFRDVTERELRETQLEVLNRVLRHNLRNTLNSIQGYAELLADRPPEESKDLLERHRAGTADLLQLGERAREFEQLEIRDQGRPRSVRVAPVVQGLVDELSEEFPDVEVVTEVPPELTVETYPTALEIALRNLLRNAAEHNDQRSPTVEVTVTETDDAVEFNVLDDGPGIPEHELSVLDADAESALDHGSGLGLWVTKWAVQYLGGRLRFQDNDPIGTIATVRLPRTPKEATSNLSSESP